MYVPVFVIFTIAPLHDSSTGTKPLHSWHNKLTWYRREHPVLWTRLFPEFPDPGNSSSTGSTTPHKNPGDKRRQ